MSLSMRDLGDALDGSGSPRTPGGGSGAALGSSPPLRPLGLGALEAALARTDSEVSASGGSPLSGGTRTRRREQAFIIGVSGGTASGKTTVCSRIMHRLHDSCAVIVHQDSFYRPLTPQERADVSNYNFDHPDAFDRDALLRCILDLRAGRSVEVPVYDFVTHSRKTDETGEVRKVEAADVVIVEGILVLHDERLREHLNMKFVKPAFDQFVAPSRRYADVIIPWQRGDNLVAIDLITEHIRAKMTQHHLRRRFPNLEVLPSNYQIRGMHTILRDRTTNKNDFVFYADRLNRLIVEAGLGHLPFIEKQVTTPTGAQYVGVEFARRLCGDVIYEKLPADIAQRHVLLMDPILSTGNSAATAVEVLLSKGVAEDKIFLLCIIAAPEGIVKICSRFPTMKVITSEVDKCVDENTFAVIPGCGDFGNRYFCE
ncbi:uridine kinase chloroplastic [Raphidocelis subcapitata]|uniref:uridine/cytidine kinase n=1 Tax=Raphidocelis subcapitata TaxID=307507 RepID=A0A2V0P4M3_9CHLO|nr:uridine kinase chloroplastic [Raphidocelis subcapitata]|eukprot:GBF94831.1 uridine kinase chloroplastic [Raphidocelis subcapitata]